MVQLVDPDEPRYRLLETLREFGQERLRATGSLAPVEGRHREWFLDLAERAAVGLDGADEGRWAARIDRDLDNLRAAHVSAVRASDLAVASRLVATLREYSFRRVRYEIAGWGEATMQMDGFARSPSAPIVVGVAAYGRWVRGDLEDADRARPSLDRPGRVSSACRRAASPSGSSAMRCSSAARRRRRCAGWSGWSWWPRRAARRRT